MAKVGIYSTKLTKPSQKRLLVINSYGSYVTVNYIWEAYSNNIHIIYLPIHTSHLL